MHTFLGAELVEPAMIGGLTLDDPPTWLVRVRFTYNGELAVIAWRFENEQAARDLLKIADADPETIVVMAADMLTQDDRPLEHHDRRAGAAAGKAVGGRSARSPGASVPGSAPGGLARSRLVASSARRCRGGYADRERRRGIGGNRAARWRWRVRAEGERRLALVGLVSATGATSEGGACRTAPDHLSGSAALAY
jgi:hypothetical protein